MYGIFLDGESKTGKTTVGLAVERALSPYFKIHTTAAGSFYRRVTLLAVELHQAADGADTAWLEAALKEALASDAAYDEERDWTNAHSPKVDELVSVAGQFEFMQAAGRDWWHKTADLALEQAVDVLVVDGRNPRKKLARWRAEHPDAMPIALDLCVYCTPEEAGRRYAADYADGEPTADQIAAATAMIDNRRHLDRSRAASPYEEPANQLLFEPLTGDAVTTIRESFESAKGDPPRVIRYDTTESPMPITLHQAGALAQSAVEYLKNH